MRISDWSSDVCSSDLVTDPDAVAAAFRQIESDLAAPLSILVNNAGVAHTRAALDLSASEWSQVLQPNLTGAFLVAQQAACMMRGEGGTIVNVASILGERVRSEEHTSELQSLMRIS